MDCAILKGLFSGLCGGVSTSQLDIWENLWTPWRVAGIDPADAGRKRFCSQWYRLYSAEKGQVNACPHPAMGFS